jgi:hypothetical protein
MGYLLLISPDQVLRPTLTLFYAPRSSLSEALPILKKIELLVPADHPPQLLWCHPPYIRQIASSRRDGGSRKDGAPLVNDVLGSGLGAFNFDDVVGQTYDIHAHIIFF